MDRRITGASPDCEIVGPDHHFPAADPGCARDEVGGLDGDEAPVAVVLAESGQSADLREAAGVGKPVNALAYSQSARIELTLYLLRPAHGQGELAPPRYFGYFRHPSSDRALVSGFQVLLPGWLGCAPDPGLVVRTAHARLQPSSDSDRSKQTQAASGRPRIFSNQCWA